MHVINLMANGEVIKTVPSGSPATIPGLYISSLTLDWPGATVDGVVYTTAAIPAPPEPAEAPITDEMRLKRIRPVSHAQMIGALVLIGIITEAEGVAWISGTLPTAVTAMIDALPPEQRVMARLRAIRPSEVVPTDPLVLALGDAHGKTTADMIDLFALAASL